jgi:hypothetical protein
MYAEPGDLRVFCGYEADDTEAISDDAAGAAILYAQGIIDDFCNTTFEDPRELGEGEGEEPGDPIDIIYLFDGNNASSMLAPSAGPFAEVNTIESRSGDDWTEFTGDWWIKHGGEVLTLSGLFCAGNLNWRVSGACYTVLSEKRLAMLKRATLMIARLAVIPKDEPLGPSPRQVSYEGVSYSYQPTDQYHPTGIDEVDNILRSLRRTVSST